jgi:hypothetical protein
MSFSEDEYNRIALDIEGFLEKEVQDLAFTLVGALRDAPVKGGTGTPIDTGFARNNWIPTVGAPSGSVYGNKYWDKTKHAYVAELDDSGAAGGVAQVASWKLGMGDIYITNNVEYINRTNMPPEYLKRQTSGYVERAIQSSAEKLRVKRGKK